MRSAAVGKDLTIGLALALLVLLVFQDVRHHEFVNYDDEVYVTENSFVRQGLTLESISWAFGSRVSRHWHPLTWLSHMLDVEFYGLNAAGHHLTNLLLHTVNTVLLFIVVARMTGSVWGGAFVAALFALHPLHVEPVAWISDRKDLLADFFWILTTGLYFLWTKHRSPVRYAALLAAFACGLMSKAVLVSLPVVLLLLDYWPLGRLSFAVSAQGGGLRALADRMGSALRALGPRVTLKKPSGSGRGPGKPERISKPAGRPSNQTNPGRKVFAKARSKTPCLESTPRRLRRNSPASPRFRRWPPRWHRKRCRCIGSAPV